MVGAPRAGTGGIPRASSCRVRPYPDSREPRNAAQLGFHGTRARSVLLPGAGVRVLAAPTGARWPIGRCAPGPFRDLRATGRLVRREPPPSRDALVGALGAHREEPTGTTRNGTGRGAPPKQKPAPGAGAGLVSRGSRAQPAGGQLAGVAGAGAAAAAAGAPESVSSPP